MQNEPQFAIGDIRRSKDCQDQMEPLLSNAIDIMITHGWEIDEILKAAELLLKERRKPAETDRDPERALSETVGTPYPDAPRAG